MRARLGDIPHQPGVYLMLDRLGSVIYVGKARDLRKRLGNHFMPSRSQSADHKTRALLRIAHCKCQDCGTPRKIWFRIQPPAAN